MKLAIIFCLTTLLQVNASGYAQKISLSVKNAPMEKVLREIKKQANYNFLYNTQMLESSKPVNFSVTNASLDEVLRLCFNDQPLTYSIVDGTIIIAKKPILKSVNQVQIVEEVYPPQEIKGKVTDAQGVGLSGVSVRLKNSTIGVSTDINGNFTISIPDAGILVFSYIGFVTIELPSNARSAMNVVLQES